MAMNSSQTIRHIRAAYAHLPPFVIVEESNGIPVLKGFMPEILKVISSWMNFNVTLIHEPEDSYGTLINNTWTGMCGMLYRNEVDIVLNPLLPTDNFFDTTFYTNPVTIEAFTMLSGKAVEDGGLFLYFNVLTPTVWVGIGISLIAIATAAMAVYKNIPHSISLSWFRTWEEYIWFFLAFMFSQGPSEKWIMRKSNSPLSLFLPLLTTIWAVGIAFLVMNVFQSRLVSKLTIVKSQPLINTMEDFVRKKEIFATSAEEIEIQEVLHDSGILLYEEAWKRVEPNLMNMDKLFSDEILDQAEKGKLAMIHGYLILEKVLMERFEKRGTCNFHLVEHHFFPFPLLMGLRKSLPESFLHRFNIGLTRLTDADLTGKWFKPIKRGFNLCSTYQENNLKPLNIKNLYGVLAMWSAGVIISVFALSWEILQFKLKKGSDSSINC